MGKKIILITALVLLSIFMSGCMGQLGNANTGKKTYYTGYDSIEMKFATDSPPDTFYYDPECDIYNDCENEIPVVVELKNKGASDSYGALYIHGYDPNIISVAGDMAYMPRGSFFRISGNTQSGYTIELGGQGIYLGYRGGGTSPNSRFSVNQNNRPVYFGLGAFTDQGGVTGVNFQINQPGRIGFSLGHNSLDRLRTSCGNNICGFRTIFALPGDTAETPGGGIEVFEFPSYIFGLPPSLESFKQPIAITACYDYVTRATAMMCIDPNPNNNIRKVCRAGGVSLSSGQGAPLAITRIDQIAANKKSVFTIHVKHNKKDQTSVIYDWQQLYKCNPNSGSIVKATDLNVAYVGYIALSGRPDLIECTPQDGKIRLDESGNGQITCTAFSDNNVESAYEAPLEIELWYGYSKTIQKNINIRRI